MFQIYIISTGFNKNEGKNIMTTSKKNTIVIKRVKSNAIY